MAIRSFAKRHPLLTYFVLAFGISWPAIFAIAGPSGIPGTTEDAGLFPFVFLAMITGPSLASIVATALVDGRTGLHGLVARFRRWRVSPFWYAVALLTTPLALIAVLLPLSLASPAFSLGVATASDRIALLAFAVVGGLLAGSFEELGWTGFVTPRLLSRYSALVAGLLLGPIWMTWHVLGDYWGFASGFGQLYLPHVAGWYLALIAYRILMNWVYSHCQSLLLGQLMHASFTGSQALLEPAAADPAVGVLWYSAFAAALWLVVAAVAVATRGELAHGCPGCLGCSKCDPWAWLKRRARGLVASPSTTA